MRTHLSGWDTTLSKALLDGVDKPHGKLELCPLLSGDVPK